MANDKGYVPFGIEWENSMTPWSKAELINHIRQYNKDKIDMIHDLQKIIEKIRG